VPVVLDASAYLAYILDEPGAERVEEIMANDEAIFTTTVNAVEVLTKMMDITTPPGTWPDLPGVVNMEPFRGEDVWYTAGLRLFTRPLGLSLADRVCLALGYRLHLPVLTADRAWADLDPVQTNVEVQLIR
jgi:ribonuclease VapC